MNSSEKFSTSILIQAASDFATPTYVYSLDVLKENLAHLKQYFPKADLHYALKANPSGGLVKEMASLGLGAEVITLGELQRAIHAGVPRLILGGPAQSPQLIEAALANGVRQVSLDSLSQLASWQDLLKDTTKDNSTWPEDLSFFIRVNPALDPQTHPHLATGAVTSKFGMTSSEAAQAAEQISKVDAKHLAGFHVHAGSQIHALDVYDDIFKCLRPLYEQFRSSDVKALNLGGGFIVSNELDFDFEGLRQKVDPFVNEFGLELILEPGRFLTANAGVLLTQVLHVKDHQSVGGNLHVICDAGMADLIRPALYSANHPMYVLGKEDAEQNVLADVDGPLCENADRLAQQKTLSEIAQGDILVVEQAGAYGLTMASNYASSFRPAEVLIKDNEAKLIRKRESFEDLVSLEIL